MKQYLSDFYRIQDKQKLKLIFIYIHPAIPLLGLYLKSPETLIQKNLCTPMFIAAQFAIAKSWKRPKCPSVNKWIKNLWYICTIEFYTEERKKEAPTLHDSMDGTGEHYAK